VFFQLRTREKQAEVITKLENRIAELETFNRMLQQTYGDDIVQKAVKALEQGKLTEAQFRKIVQQFETHN